MKQKKENKFGARYDDAFKASAIKLARSSDKNLDAVASLLGVAGRTLRMWLRQAAIDEGGGGGEGALTTDERRELRRLRREVEDLQTANTILKKAAAFSEAKQR